MARQSLPGAEVPDPGRITGPQDFGRELSLARQQAGLTIREVARASGIPASTVGDYFAGRHLPPVRQPELLARVLAACGITNPGQVERWQEALNRICCMLAAPAAPRHRGWPASSQDAAWFFGRKNSPCTWRGWPPGRARPGSHWRWWAVRVWQVLAAAGGAGPLAAHGHSGPAGRPPGGAGHAGRLAGGRPGPWPGAPVARAGSEGPLQAGLLAQGLRQNPERYARLAGRGDEPPAIIVDQLEEIFTAGAGETGRQEFVAALAALAEHTLVVTGLRADFYSHALNYPALAHSLQERQIVVGPMADQLRRAIVEPRTRRA
jgi:transcriptional regulator with XRE-family HTH domain